MRRLEFHFTPKHASWLNMVEIEIGVLRGQCLDRRIDKKDRVVAEIAAWEKQRNEACARINWMFTPSVLAPSSHALTPTQPKSHNWCAEVRGDRVVMEETLPGALAALFKESTAVAGLPAPAGSSPSGPADERAQQALADYDRALDRLKAGDWAGFGAELDALRPLLEELSRQPAAR